MALNAPWWALARVLLGLLFVTSAFIKLSEPSANFVAVIEAYEVVSGDLAYWLAMGLPWVELAGGVFCLLGLWTRYAIWTLWLMISVFIGVVVSSLVRKLPITDCGCFGEAFSLPLEGLLCLDIGLWFLCAVLLWKLEHTALFSVDTLYRKGLS